MSHILTSTTNKALAYVVLHVPDTLLWLPYLPIIACYTSSILICLQYTNQNPNLYELMSTSNLLCSGHGCIVKSCRTPVMTPDPINRHLFGPEVACGMAHCHTWWLHGVVISESC